MLEAQNRFPDIAGVEPPLAIRPLGWLIQWNGVVQQDDRLRATKRLDIHEVLERLLIDVEPVDERER